MVSFPGSTAVAGIGATEFSKESGRSELQLAAEAVSAALADAGLTPADVDGLVTFTMDTNAEIAVARELGIGDLRSSAASTTAAARPAPPCSRRRWPSPPASPRSWSATAAFNERSGRRFGQPDARIGGEPVVPGLDDALARTRTG